MKTVYKPKNGVFQTIVCRTGAKLDAVSDDNGYNCKGSDKIDFFTSFHLSSSPVLLFKAQHIK